MPRRPNLTGAFVLAALLAACNSGGGVVNPNDPLNPNGASTAAATPSPTPGAPTPTPSPAPTGVSPTPTVPTPTPTATTGTQVCTHSTASPSSRSYTLNGQPETIQIPVYNGFTGSSDVPSQSPSGTVLTGMDSQNNFDTVTIPSSTGGDPAYANRTKDFFGTIKLSQTTTFGNGSNQLLVPITVNSACIVPGVTYYLDEFALNSFQYVESAVATSGGSVTGHIKVTVNPFPGNTTAGFVLSH